MSTLLTKPISEITYDDVTRFCDPVTGPCESQRLEYKGGGVLPSSRDIAKAASALANTFGGTLILGVDEDHQSGRPTGIPGVPGVRDIENQVSSILMDNINPPLVPLPEIHAVSLPDQPDRAVVVIRIAPSNATPHACRGNNGGELFYVRTRSQSRPEDWDVTASLDRLEWLFNRRRKSETLHDRIRDEALDRIKLYYERGRFVHFSGSERPHGQAVFWTVPLYPEGTVTTVQDLYDRCVGAGVPTDRRLQVTATDSSLFPEYSWMTPATTQDGVVGLTELHDTQVRSFEFNTCGLFLYQETVAFRLPAPLDETWNLDFDAMCRQLRSFLQLASRFYDLADAVGLLELHVKVMNLQGLCMLPPDAGYAPIVDQVQHAVSHQREVDCVRTVLASLLRDPEQREETLLGLLCEIGNAFNWQRAVVRQVVDRIPR